MEPWAIHIDCCQVEHDKYRQVHYSRGKTRNFFAATYLADIQIALINVQGATFWQHMWPVHFLIEKPANSSMELAKGQPASELPFWLWLDLVHWVLCCPLCCTVERGPFTGELWKTHQLRGNVEAERCSPPPPPSLINYSVLVAEPMYRMTFQLSLNSSSQ